MAPGHPRATVSYAALLRKQELYKKKKKKTEGGSEQLLKMRELSRKE